MRKVVLVMSGGQDSGTLLFWCLKKFPELEAIHFQYGQKHKVETDYARRLCEEQGVPFHVFDLSVLSQVANSALVSGGNVNETNEIGLPSSFVPNRNQLFLTLAHTFAQKTGAGAVVIGANAVDYSGYPDCRKEYLEELERVTNLGSSADIRILAPLVELSKKEIWDMAEELGCLDKIIRDTLTCYNGNETPHYWGRGCGECPACEIRKKSYKEHGNG